MDDIDRYLKSVPGVNAQQAAAMTHFPQQPNPAQSQIDFIKALLQHYGSLIKSGLTAPQRALTGELQVNDPATGMPTPQSMGAAKDFISLLTLGGMPMASRGAAGAVGGRLTQPPSPKTFYEISREYPTRSNDAFHQGADAYARAVGTEYTVPPSNLTKEQLQAWDDGVRARMRFEAQLGRK